MMPTIAAAAPAAPVPLVELKAFLRIGNSEEDALLAAIVRAAAETCEAFTGTALLVREVKEIMAASTVWSKLSVSPVRAIEGVETIDGDGAAAALAAGDYALDIDAAGDGWARIAKPTGARRVCVTYSAGMASDPNGLPEALRHGIVRLAAHLYAHRDAGGEDTAGPPAAVTALWRPWRRLRLN
jgi:uncharacterized phiE125 gp8 family phage protein